MLRKIALCLSLTLFLGLISACSPKGIVHPNSSESPKNNQSEISETVKNAGNTNPSEPAGEQTDSNIREITAPVAVPPSFGNGDPYESSGNQSGSSPPSISAIPGLQPMKGVNVETLFAEKLKDSDDRFARLENAVIDMRKEMNNVMPSIIRLIAIESDIQTLTKELDGLLQETPPPADSFSPTNLTGSSPPPDPSEAELNVEQLNPQPEAPIEQSTHSIPTLQESNAEEKTPTVSVPTITTPPPTVPQQENTPVLSENHVLKLPPNYSTQPNVEKTEHSSNPASKSASVTPPKPQPKQIKKSNEKTASALRLGEYADKVRIVIDTTQKPNVTTDYDPEENIIVMEISDAKWIGETEKTFSSSKLIESYSASPHADGKGATIAISLKKNSKILKQGSVDPDENPNYRYYIDLSL